MKKTTLAALACLAALAPTPSPASTVTAPHEGTVTATTYYASGAFHGAVDISGGTCGVTPVHAPLQGTLSWDITLRSSVIQCTTATQNEAAHTFADGYTFRLWNFNKSASSYDRTCDRCELGTVGYHTHLQYDRYGTQNTSWYSSYTVKGEYLSQGELVGYTH